MNRLFTASYENVWLGFHSKQTLCCAFLIAWKETDTRWQWSDVREWNRHLAAGVASNLGETWLQCWCPFWHHKRISIFPQLWTRFTQFSLLLVLDLVFLLEISKELNFGQILQIFLTFLFLLWLWNFHANKISEVAWRNRATSLNASVALVRIHSELVQARPKQGSHSLFAPPPARWVANYLSHQERRESQKLERHGRKELSTNFRHHWKRWLLHSSATSAVCNRSA